ncbi:hypothetical protein [uncultured Alistipes sp.]|uniref:hypothetical protein n=1 Tax=uncultured Alistipes sp. TaxID=538949 RepID=UPI002731FA9E|nr:hypothetical protein [uncultured Alistipes sp.]
MTAFIIIAACLVCLDRMFFKGQLLSIFIDGAQAFLCRRGRPSATDRAEPAEAMPPPALVITRRYANGPKRPAGNNPSKGPLYLHGKPVRSRR